MEVQARAAGDRGGSRAGDCRRCESGGHKRRIDRLQAHVVRAYEQLVRGHARCLGPSDDLHGCVRRRGPKVLDCGEVGTRDQLRGVARIDHEPGRRGVAGDLERSELCGNLL